MRPHGKPNVLERRRLRAIALLNQGQPFHAVAAQTHASLSSVVRWHQAYQKTGRDGLRPKQTPGRPCLLSENQKQKLLRVLIQGPLEAGYSTEVWTLKRIGALIRKHFGIHYCTSNLWYLMDGLGWSCQKPTKKAKERREEAIRYWKRSVWPHIKKAEELGAHLVFVDESGFLLIPTVIHSWAPRGKTPILPTAGRWTKISAVSGISVSPKRRRLGLYIRFYRNRNIRNREVIIFVRHLLKHIKGHVVLLWDSSPVHRAAPVQNFLEGYRRLHVYRFPGYAPELNPDEFIWTQLKRALANSIPKNLAHLRQLLRVPVEKVRNSQRLLRSCILASDLPW